MSDRLKVTVVAINDKDKPFKLKNSSVIVEPGVYILSICDIDGGKKYFKLPLYLKDVIEDNLENYKFHNIIPPKIFSSKLAFQTWYNRLPSKFKVILGNNRNVDFDKLKLFFNDLEMVCYNSTLNKNNYGVVNFLNNWFRDYINPLSEDPTGILRNSLNKCCNDLSWITGSRVNYLTERMVSKNSVYNGFIKKSTTIEGKPIYKLNKEWFELVLAQHIMVKDLPNNSSQRKFIQSELKFGNEI